MGRTSVEREPRFGCGNFSVVGPLKGKPGFGVRCLFCGSYRCNRCRGPKLKKMRSRMAELSTEFKLQRMGTLTLDPKTIPARYRGRTDRYIFVAHDARTSLAKVRGEFAVYCRFGVHEKRCRPLACAFWSLHPARVALGCVAIHRWRKDRGYSL